jgi:hypothetical protein
VYTVDLLHSVLSLYSIFSPAFHITIISPIISLSLLYPIWEVENILIIAIEVIILCVRGGIIEYGRERTHEPFGRSAAPYLRNEYMPSATDLNRCSLTLSLSAFCIGETCIFEIKGENPNHPK